VDFVEVGGFRGFCFLGRPFGVQPLRVGPAALCNKCQRRDYDKLGGQFLFRQAVFRQAPFQQAPFRHLLFPFFVVKTVGQYRQLLGHVKHRVRQTSHHHWRPGNAIDLI